MRIEAFAVILDFELERFREKSQPHPGFTGVRMARDIVQRFLQDAVEMNRAAVERKSFAGLCIVNGDTRLFLRGGKIPAYRALEPRFFEHHGMESLRERADFVQRGLRDFGNFAQFGAERRIRRRVLFCAAQHRANGCQNLAEFVVQLSRNVAQGRFLGRDEFLGQLAALLGKRGKLREEAPIRSDEIEAGEENRRERRCQKQVHLALDAIVDCPNLLRRLFFAFVVFDEQPGDGGRQRSLAGLKRQANLRASFGGLAVARECKGAVDGVPELLKRAAEIMPLVGGAGSNGDLLLDAKRIIEVGANALELRLPRRERVALIVVEHVAHAERERIKVILDSQELQRILAIAIGDIVLEFAQAGYLARDVKRIRDNGNERDDQAEEEARSWSASRRALHAPRIYRRPGNIQRRGEFRRAIDAAVGRSVATIVPRMAIRCRTKRGQLPEFRGLCVRALVLAFIVALGFARTAAAQSQESPSAAPLTPMGPQQDAHGYVGNEQCAKCHAGIYQSYSQTAMARASGPATQDLIAADFTHKPSGVHFRVYAEAGRAWLSFERPGDPSVAGKRELLYVIGSGHRGKTYIFDTDGFFFESPINWYAQKKIWDMAPAFQNAQQIPMNLPALPGCLSCHTSGMQPPAKGTENKYAMPLFAHDGITCERCHGPGAAHASGGGAIVDPAKLAPERRDQVCMQCHLEGNVAIEQPGRRLYEFQPGENLFDTIRYFVFPGGGTGGLRALGQFEALAQSVCKKKSGDAMSCTSCHDPHSSPGSNQRVSYYRSKCLACHGEAFGEKHHVDKPDCMQCHMPRIASADVAHTQATDHRILKLPEMPLQDLNTSRQPQLVPFPPGPTDDRDLALAWESVAMNGSAFATGEAERRLDAVAKDKPDDPALLAALGFMTQKEGDTDGARKLYERALSIDPLSNEAATNLGVIEARDGHLNRAVQLWQGAFERLPGQSAIGIDLALTYCSAKKIDRARDFVLRVLEFNPDLGAAKTLLQHLNADPPNCSTH